MQMTARVFTLVWNPHAEGTPTMHVAKWKDGRHVPQCGTRTRKGQELSVTSGIRQEVTCEKCLHAVRKAQGLA